MLISILGAGCSEDKDTSETKTESQNTQTAGDTQTVEQTYTDEQIRNGTQIVLQGKVTDITESEEGNLYTVRVEEEEYWFYLKERTYESKDGEPDTSDVEMYVPSAPLSYFTEVDAALDEKWEERIQTNQIKYDGATDKEKNIQWQVIIFLMRTNGLKERERLEQWYGMIIASLISTRVADRFDAGMYRYSFDAEGYTNIAIENYETDEEQVPYYVED